MNKFQTAFLNIGLLAVVALSAAPAAAGILTGGAGSDPDPSWNGNAMQTWLRGDSNVVMHTSNIVAEWSDKSNNANNAQQYFSSTLRPTLVTSFGGKQAIDFAGNGSRLHFATGFDSTFDGSFTIFSLLAPSDGDPFRDSIWFGLVSADAQSRVVLNNSGTDNVVAALYKAGNDSGNIFIPPPWPDGAQSEFMLITWVVTAGGTHEMFVNGSPVAAGSVDGSGVTNANFASGGVNAFLGAASASNGVDPWPSVLNTFPGQIAEFMIYDGALSTSDREAVEDYLLGIIIPEPASCVLLTLGCVGLLARRQRQAI